MTGWADPSARPLDDIRTYLGTLGLMATSKSSAAIASPDQPVTDVPAEFTADAPDVTPADPRNVGDKVLLKDDRGDLVIGTVVAPVDEHHVLVQAHGVEASVALSKLKSA